MKRTGVLENEFTVSLQYMVTMQLSYQKFVLKNITSFGFSFKKKRSFKIFIKSSVFLVFYVDIKFCWKIQEMKKSLYRSLVISSCSFMSNFVTNISNWVYYVYSGKAFDRYSCADY